MKKNNLIVTLNPAMDYMFWPKENAWQISQGGKGKNVVRALTILGQKSTDLTPAIQEQRVNTTIYTNKNKPLRFMGVAQKVTPRCIAKFKKDYGMKLNQTQRVVICGSAPKGMASLYTWMIVQAKQRKIPVWVDASQQALTLSVEAKPDLFKPNLEELEGLVGVSLSTLALQKKALKYLVQQGVATVVLTLGPAGAMICNQDELWYAKSPKRKVMSTLGCGDAFLAGLIFSTDTFKASSQHLKHAVAIASASTATLIPGDFYKAHYQSLLKNIKVQSKF